MRPSLSRGMMIAGAVVAVLALMFAFFIMTFNLNSAKPRLEQAARERFGIELDIRGDISMGMENLLPSVVFHDIAAGQGNDSGRLTAEKLEVQIPLQLGGGGRSLSLHAALEGAMIDAQPLGSYDLPIRIEGGDVTVNDFSGELGEGRIEGSLSYVGQQLSLAARVKDLDYGYLAPGMAGGRVAGDINLSSQGADGEALIGNLGGTFVLHGGEGRLAGNDVNLWAGDMLTNILSGPQAETKISCAIVDFTVTGGRATSRRTLVNTERVVIEGDGHIDFKAGRMDMLFTPRPKEASLLSLATPMRVAGPFGAVEARADKSAVLTKLGGLLMGAVNPAAALVPFMQRGGGDHPCAQLAAEKK